MISIEALPSEEEYTRHHTSQDSALHHGRWTEEHEAPITHHLQRMSTDISDTGLKVEGDFIRAITMRRSLRQWGWIWRRPMLPMSDEDRLALFQLSKPSKGYDSFLSHSWQTWGGWKYFSLVLYSCRRWLLAWWFVWIVLAFLMSLCFDLPTYGKVSPETPGFWCRCPTGPWVKVSGLLSIVTGLLLAPYAPDSRRPNASINQRLIVAQNLCPLQALGANVSESGNTFCFVGLPQP